MQQVLAVDEVNASKSFYPSVSVLVTNNSETPGHRVSPQAAAAFSPPKLGLERVSDMPATPVSTPRKDNKMPLKSQVKESGSKKKTPKKQTPKKQVAGTPVPVAAKSEKKDSCKGLNFRCRPSSRTICLRGISIAYSSSP